MVYRELHKGPMTSRWAPYQSVQRSGSNSQRLEDKQPEDWTEVWTTVTLSSSFTRTSYWAGKVKDIKAAHRIVVVVQRKEDPPRADEEDLKWVEQDSRTLCDC
jgi:hypothetical protein